VHRSRLIVCSFTALLLASGCHPISVQTGYDPGIDFATRKTYAWHPDAKLDTGDPRFDTKLMERTIRSAADATLASKGFQKTDSGNPDFLVGYEANLGFGTSSVTGRRSLGSNTGDFGWTVSHTVDYDTGALVLEMLDPTTDRILWEAVASTVVVERATATERKERVDKAVRKMLADFPPR